MNFLSGKKTYLVAVVGVLINGAWQMGYLPQEYIIFANMILGFFGLAALRAGVKK